MLLKDRVAIVTGASRGIGAVASGLLTQKGARVALVARTVSDLEAYLGLPVIATISNLHEENKRIAHGA